MLQTKRGRKEVIRSKKLCEGCSNDKFDEKGKKRKNINIEIDRVGK